MAAADDTHLLQRLLKGEQRAYKDLVNTYQSAMRAVAYAIVGQRHAALDHPLAESAVGGDAHRLEQRFQVRHAPYSRGGDLRSADRETVRTSSTPSRPVVATRASRRRASRTGSDLTGSSSRVSVAS